MTAKLKGMPTLKECREVAARVWCDPMYRHMVMNVDLCERIAQLLFAEGSAGESNASEMRPAGSTNPGAMMPLG